MASVLATPPAGGSGLQAVPCSGRNSILEIMSMRRDPFAFADRRRARFGNVSGLDAFGVRMVVTGDPPRAAQEILMNKDRAFANGPAWSYFIGPFFNRGVMLLDFDEHRHHRHILQQAFSTSALKGYMQEMQPMIAERVGEFPVGSVRLFEQFKALTLDVALEVFLGLNLPRDEADRINKAFIDTVRAGVAYVRKPVPGGRWWKGGLRSRKVLEEFFYANIAAKRARETPDLFSVLCHAESDEGDRFSDEDVVNHMIFVLMAAHDTSTITMTQMAYHMAKRPSAGTCPVGVARTRTRTRIRQPREHDCAGPGDEGVAAALSAGAGPAPHGHQGHLGPGFSHPRGTIVTTSSLSGQRDPEFFTNPDMFDPERFGPERAEDKSHRFAWMPFGGGVHKCIGLYFGQMEIKTIMHHLLRGYEWSVPADYTMPMDYSALPVPKDKFPVTLRRR